MAIQEVRVVSVPVSDQERAKEFYVEKLGFELSREDDSIPGIRWVQVTPQGGTTSLTLVTWFETMPPGSLQGLVLGSADLEKDCEELVARGWSSIGPCSSSRGGRRRWSATPTGTGSSSSKPDRGRDRT
jgi:catechol 2,3-dioxygenase-like lactoylglutathione lyase family enzyme